MSFPVRLTFSLQRFPSCELEEEERTHCCSSSCLYGFWGVRPSPFPGDCGKGGGRGLGVYEPQPLASKLILLLGFRVVGALLVLRLSAASASPELRGRGAVPALGEAEAPV